MSTPPKRSKAWILWTLILLLLLAGGYFVFERSKPKANAAASGTGGGAGRRGGGPTPVSTAAAKRGDIGVYINALGTVTPVYTVSVASRVAGQLLEVRYREGQIVQKGDILATIDPSPYQPLVTQAQGQLQRDQALLKNSLIDLDRYQTVFAQHAIPEQTVATQQATVDQNRGTVKVDQGNLDAAMVNLNYATIRSPITGRVGLRTVDPGNIVQANGTTGIATVAQIQPITVIFTVAEDYIDQIVSQMKDGRRLEVIALDRSSEHEISRGFVLTLDNQVDTTTGTVRVRANFSNSKFELFPNEFVNARLLVKTLRNVTLIPTAAVQRNNDVAFVYVVDPSTKSVHSRNIQVNTSNGDVAAATGISAGDTLVTDGFDRLVDGGKVAPSRRAPKAANTSDESTSSSEDPDQPHPTISGNHGRNSMSTATAEGATRPKQHRARTGQGTAQ